LRQFIYCGIRLGMFKVIEDSVKAREKRNLTFGEKIAYSLLTGGIGSVIANPTDMALIRFQSDNNLPPAERRNYKNVFDALGRIYKEEGVRGLWRGSVPTVARAMSVNCSHLVGYNESKEQLMAYLGEKKETMNIRLVASAISGIAVAICSLPFDNVKTKVLKMKPSKYRAI
jgi:solute carrier family 25 (mitochondrial oxoglutarate transporter), member 11